MTILTSPIISMTHWKAQITKLFFEAFNLSFYLILKKKLISFYSPEHSTVQKVQQIYKSKLDLIQFSFKLLWVWIILYTLNDLSSGNVPVRAPITTSISEYIKYLIPHSKFVNFVYLPSDILCLGWHTDRTISVVWRIWDWSSF